MNTTPETIDPNRGAALLAELDAICDKLRSTNYPQLKIVSLNHTGVVYRGLECPHCGNDVNEDEQLVRLDIGLRETIAEYVDPAALNSTGHIQFIFDEDDRTPPKPVLYKCLSCDNPVNLPVGWLEKFEG